FPWFFVWWLLTVIGSGGFLFWMLRPPARCFLSVAPSILAGLGGILARLDVGVYAGNGYSIGANHVWESKLSALAAQKAELIGKYRSRRGVRRRIKRGKPLKNNPAITRITPRNLRSSRRSRNHD
ncbi:MAG: hypothetical protein Q4C71_01080, partial [Microbacteriaceae bacterium]|nr:hypothetical protein [Microbacteriaceae bacterium]